MARRRQSTVPRFPGPSGLEASEQGNRFSQLLGRLTGWIARARVSTIPRSDLEATGPAEAEQSDTPDFTAAEPALPFGGRRPTIPRSVNPESLPVDSSAEAEPSESPAGSAPDTNA